MKQEKLNYEARIFFYKKVDTFNFQFYAENKHLASDHARHCLMVQKEGEVIHYRKIGNAKWIIISKEAATHNLPADQQPEAPVKDKEVQDMEGEKIAAMRIALEFGYKQCEKGNNLDMAFINFNKLIQSPH
jgi:hypothetical protein